MKIRLTLGPFAIRLRREECLVALVLFRRVLLSPSVSMDGEGVELGHVERKVGLGNDSRCRPGGIADLLTKYIIAMLSLCSF